MKILSYLTIASILFGLFSCTQQEEKKKEYPNAGIWKGEISLNDSTVLPFNFELDKVSDSSYSMLLFNADEEIDAQLEWHSDSLKITLPVFANYFMVAYDGESMNGFFIKPDADNYRLPFKAHYGDSARFRVKSPKCCDINEKWAMKFSPDSEEETPAIAYFEQFGANVKGTVLTETGDYRYLQGVLDGEHLRLSAFDGSNLYLFDARIEDGQQFKGLLYSGRSSVKPWVAYRDDSFTLRNADSLTYLKEGYDSFNFNFADLDGKSLSLNDKRFENKAVIVQIMGSWCPNCMDETRYLLEVYDQYKDRGLEVVGITFERAANLEVARKRVDKMITDLDINYPVLIGGATREDKAAEKLPMLNHIISFPTTIYLNKKHEIVKIHTGFTGPGTPVFEDFKQKNKAFIEEMLPLPTENK